MLMAHSKSSNKRKVYNKFLHQANRRHECWLSRKMNVDSQGPRYDKTNQNESYKRKEIGRIRIKINRNFKHTKDQRNDNIFLLFLIWDIKKNRHVDKQNSHTLAHSSSVSSSCVWARAPARDKKHKPPTRMSRTHCLGHYFCLPGWVVRN